MPTHPLNSAPGLYVPQSIPYDSQTITAMDVQSPEFKDFLVKLTQSINRISIILNAKHTGLYNLTEIDTGKKLYPRVIGRAARPIFAKSFYYVNPLGLLAGALAIPHNLNIDLPAISQWSFVNIYGVANDPANRRYLPLPYIETTGNNISLSVDAANININCFGFARPTYTEVDITLEYTKS